MFDYGHMIRPVANRCFLKLFDICRVSTPAEDAMLEKRLKAPHFGFCKNDFVTADLSPSGVNRQFSSCAPKFPPTCVNVEVYRKKLDPWLLIDGINNTCGGITGSAMKKARIAARSSGRLGARQGGLLQRKF